MYKLFRDVVTQPCKQPEGKAYMYPNRPIKTIKLDSIALGYIYHWNPGV